MESHSPHQHGIPDRRSLVSENRQYHDIPDQHETEPTKLRPRIPLHLDGIRMEVWVSGQCVYAKLLADSEFQAVGDGKLARKKKSLGSSEAFGFGSGRHSLKTLIY
jgi:hypothetical protein